MTPETENKINNMHDTLLVMKTQWENHLEKHPKQPCDGLKILNNRLFAIAVLAIGGLMAQLWKYVTGG